MLPNSPRPLRSRQRVRVHTGTAELLARVRVLNETGEVAPGGRDFVQISLETPTSARLADRFIIRSYSPQITIAGGTVLDPLASKVRKSEFPAFRETLSKLARENAEKAELVSAFVGAAGDRGVLLNSVMARTGWKRQVLDKIVDSVVAVRSAVKAGESLVAANVFSQTKSRIISALETHHKKDPLSKGLTREALKPSRLPSEMFDAMLASLKDEKLIEFSGDSVALAAKKSGLSPEDEAIRSRILNILAGSGLQVPKTDELLTGSIAGTKASLAHAKKILFTLFDSGEAVKISEEFVFARPVIDELIAKLRGHAAQGDRTIDVPKFKDIAGVSRKYAIPLLEYFDREKVTLRIGDKRVIR